MVMMELCILCAQPIDYCQGHSDGWKQVADILHEQADELVVERIKDHVNTNRAKWIWDPEVQGVAGLVRIGTNRAIVLVYLKDEDFEVGSDFWDDVWEGDEDD